MNGIDWSILAIFLAAGGLSFINGLVKELFSIVAWLISLGIAINFLDELAKVLITLIPFADLRIGVALIILFFATFFVILWINYLIINSLGPLQVSLTERILGIWFGLARGCVIIILAIMLSGLTHLPTLVEWQESVFIHSFFKPIVLILRNQLPIDLARQFNFDSAPKQQLSL